jgi:lipopolysaccharide export LptBFGC system permease protein LptF
VARRSPTNARYQKHTEPKGQTRKSAAAAKPKRKEGSGSSSASKSKSSSSSRTAALVEPATPEYKFWRRAWWMSLVAGLLLVAVSYFLQYQLKGMSWTRTAGIVVLGLAYVAIGVAFFIEWKKLRPMRAMPVRTKSISKSSKSDDSDDQS